MEQCVRNTEILSLPPLFSGSRWEETCQYCGSQLISELKSSEISLMENNKHVWVWFSFKYEKNVRKNWLKSNVDKLRSDAMAKPHIETWCEYDVIMDLIWNRIQQPITSTGFPNVHRTCVAKINLCSDQNWISNFQFSTFFIMLHSWRIFISIFRYIFFTSMSANAISIDATA